MRFISTENLQPNMILGKNIFNEQGNVLLGEGIALSGRMINRLMDLHIPYVYIKDAHTEGIEPQDTIKDNLRRHSLQVIEESFSNVIEKGRSTVCSITIEKYSKRFIDIIRNILTEMKRQPELLTLISDLYIYDHYVYTHSFNVTLYSLAIGMELNLSDKQLEVLGISALFHDVGKLNISKEILTKTGKLNEHEYEEMKKHTEFGYQILKNIYTVPLTVAHCAHQHHERLNGTGYPKGLENEEIHHFSKILAVADVFDAVTSNRVYRRAMQPHEGLDILYEGAGTIFDQEIIEAFRNSLGLL